MNKEKKCTHETVSIHGKEQIGKCTCTDCGYSEIDLIDIFNEKIKTMEKIIDTFKRIKKNNSGE